MPAATGRLSRWDRAFELTSVVPLGVFVLVHTVDYGRILAGAETIGPRRHPSGLELFVEALVLWLPLAGHVAFSFVVWKRRRRDEPKPGAPLLLAHRLAGVLSGLFLLDHFVRFRLPILTGQAYPADSVQRLAGALSSAHGGVPWIAALQLLGIVAVAFHLAMGLRRVAERSERFGRSRAVRFGSYAAGVIAAMLGVATTLRLATGV